jgi:hypothetical protein
MKPGMDIVVISSIYDDSDVQYIRMFQKNCPRNLTAIYENRPTRQRKIGMRRESEGEQEEQFDDVLQTPHISRSPTV